MAETAGLGRTPLLALFIDRPGISNRAFVYFIAKLGHTTWYVIDRRDEVGLSIGVQGTRSYGRSAGRRDSRAREKRADPSTGRKRERKDC